MELVVCDLLLMKGFDMVVDDDDPDPDDDVRMERRWCTDEETSDVGLEEEEEQDDEATLLGEQEELFIRGLDHSTFASVWVSYVLGFREIVSFVWRFVTCWVVCSVYDLIEISSITF